MIVQLHQSFNRNFVLNSQFLILSLTIYCKIPASKFNKNSLDWAFFKFLLLHLVFALISSFELIRLFYILYLTFYRNQFRLNFGGHLKLFSHFSSQNDSSTSALQSRVQPMQIMLQTPQFCPRLVHSLAILQIFID